MRPLSKAPPHDIVGEIIPTHQQSVAFLPPPFFFFFTFSSVHPQKKLSPPLLRTRWRIRPVNLLCSARKRSAAAAAIVSANRFRLRDVHLALLSSQRRKAPPHTLRTPGGSVPISVYELKNSPHSFSHSNCHVANADTKKYLFSFRIVHMTYLLNQRRETNNVYK